jgi:hypothetical protein
MPLRIQRPCFGIAGEICKLNNLNLLLNQFEISARSPSQIPYSILTELIQG